MTPKEARGILAAEAVGLHISPKQKYEAHQIAAGLPPDDSPAPTLSWRQLVMRCTEEGNCLLWNQGLLSGRYPQARIDGKSVMVARYVYVTLLGKDVRKGHVLTTRCRNTLCLAPACLCQMTYGERLKLTYASGSRSGIKEYGSRVERLIEQGRTKCSYEIAEDIRANRMHVPAAQLARELGVHTKTAYNIKRGKTWKRTLPISSVFTLAGK
ncbi:MAG: hypothetical protein RIQ53_2683 [Pseudomonadota bacterium]|jgi:hypothetical protein